MGDVPAERPPVSHLQVSDVAGAVGDCGERCQSQLDRACELVPRREGTDAELGAVETHASEIEASDVDQDARPNDPQLQDRKERLPARERLRIGIGEGGERVVERRRSDVLDCCGDHAVAAVRIESTIDW